MFVVISHADSLNTGYKSLGGITPLKCELFACIYVNTLFACASAVARVARHVCATWAHNAARFMARLQVQAELHACSFEVVGKVQKGEDNTAGVRTTAMGTVAPVPHASMT